MKHALEQQIRDLLAAVDPDTAERIVYNLACSYLEGPEEDNSGQSVFYSDISPNTGERVSVDE